MSAFIPSFDYGGNPVKVIPCGKLDLKAGVFAGIIYA